MKEEGSLVIKKLITTPIRMVIATLEVTWVISLVSSVDLGNLAILIYYLWQTNVVADYHQIAVGILLILIILV